MGNAPKEIGHLLGTYSTELPGPHSFLHIPRLDPGACTHQHVRLLALRGHLWSLVIRHPPSHQASPSGGRTKVDREDGDA
jgi:hypothetical protein